jgi:hypothetical protein
MTFLKLEYSISGMQWLINILQGLSFCFYTDEPFEACAVCQNGPGRHNLIIQRKENGKWRMEGTDIFLCNKCQSALIGALNGGLNGH